MEKFLHQQYISICIIPVVTLEVSGNKVLLNITQNALEVTLSLSPVKKFLNINLQSTNHSRT